MTRKDFDILAQILADTLDDCDNGAKAVKLGLTHTMSTLQVSYPRFNESKFRAALRTKLTRLQSTAIRYVNP